MAATLRTGLELALHGTELLAALQSSYKVLVAPTEASNKEVLSVWKNKVWEREAVALQISLSREDLADYPFLPSRFQGRLKDCTLLYFCFALLFATGAQQPSAWPAMNSRRKEKRSHYHFAAY